MSDYTQADHVFIAHAHYTNATNYAVVGASDDVRTYLRGTVYIDHSPTEDAIANDPGISYEVQINRTDDPTPAAEDWVTIFQLDASIVASTMETLDGSAASGQKVVPVAATGDLTIGDMVYIRDDGGPGGSEWAKVAEIDSGVSFTTVDDLTNSFTSGEDVFIGGVARWSLDLEDLAGVGHVRVICTNGDGTGHNWASAAYAKYATDIE